MDFDSSNCMELPQVMSLESTLTLNSVPLGSQIRLFLPSIRRQKLKRRERNEMKCKIIYVKSILRQAFY